MAQKKGNGVLGAKAWKQLSHYRVAADSWDDLGQDLWNIAWATEKYWIGNE